MGVQYDLLQYKEKKAEVYNFIAAIMHQDNKLFAIIWL